MRTALILVSGWLGILNFAYATVIGGVQPTATTDEFQYQYPVGDFLDINPQRLWVTNAEGYAHLGSLSIDASSGKLRGYAAYQLDVDKDIVKSPNLIGVEAGTGNSGAISNLVGNLLYMAPVKAVDPNVTYSITMELTLEGSLVETTGHPTLTMLGGASIINLNATDYYSASVDAAFGNHDMVPSANALNYGPIRTDDEFIVQDSTGKLIDTPSQYGLSYQVDYPSMDPLALQSVMRLSVPVHDGDNLIFISQIAAQATHSFVDDFRILNAGESGAVAAASGYVDLSNTATLRIYTPAGLSLGGDLASLGGVVVISAVPEPSSAMMWLAGLGLAAFFGRRQRFSQDYWGLGKV